MGCDRNLSREERTEESKTGHEIYSNSTVLPRFS